MSVTSDYLDVGRFCLFLTVCVFSCFFSSERASFIFYFAFGESFSGFGGQILKLRFKLCNKSNAEMVYKIDSDLIIVIRIETKVHNSNCISEYQVDAPKTEANLMVSLIDSSVRK